MQTRVTQFGGISFFQWPLYNFVALMTVKVNGDSREIPDGETVRALVARYNLIPEKVAIELNRRLVRSEKYDLSLKDGDEVEIVTFVGGG
jgi:thiamine biosynthesis protein ThiS